ncbi:MAG: ferric reductase-like transmembrane domain-containing protein [Candidatus Moraniibacteriota bacterium]
MNGKHKIILFSFLAFFVLGFHAHTAFGIVKDSDVDGLSDDAETTVYHTDPLVFDTDGDGVGDGQEVLDGTDPLDKNSSSLAAIIVQDPGLLGSPVKFAWYLGRASGILAFTLLSGVVIFGLIMSSRAFNKFVPGATVYETHKFISWLALATVILHFSSFFFDSFMKLKVVEALVPFSLSRSFPTAMGYDMGLSVALGVIAFYLMLILIFTSEFRSKISPKVWRAIHYISAIAYFLFIAHGFLTGTDSKEWWMRALYATSASTVFVLILIRILSRNLIPSIRAWWKSKTEGADVPLEN